MLVYVSWGFFLSSDHLTGKCQERLQQQIQEDFIDYQPQTPTYTTQLSCPHSDNTILWLMCQTSIHGSYRTQPGVEKIDPTKKTQLLSLLYSGLDNRFSLVQVGNGSSEFQTKNLWVNYRSKLWPHSSHKHKVLFRSKLYRLDWVMILYHYFLGYSSFSWYWLFKI